MEVETLSSKLKDKRPPVQIIQHKSRKRINKIQKTNYLNSDTLNSKTDEKVNLRKLQNEIFKFTTHFDARNTKAKEQLAIKLGAKPRKKSNSNYKQLKEKLKQDAETKKNQEELFKLPKTMVRTSKNNNKRSNIKKIKQSTDIIKNYGTIKNKK
ncbi:hypothetical protein QTP88_018368 [Uroleucon formosanum]